MGLRPLKWGMCMGVPSATLGVCSAESHSHRRRQTEKRDSIPGPWDHDLSQRQDAQALNPPGTFECFSTIQKRKAFSHIDGDLHVLLVLTFRIPSTHLGTNIELLHSRVTPILVAPDRTPRTRSQFLETLHSLSVLNTWMKKSHNRGEILFGWRFSLQMGMRIKSLQIGAVG